MEAIKDLLAKIPNLSQLIEEAQKPPETIIAETAYIYNGYRQDVTLMHLGIEYPCKAGEVTTIFGMPDYKEVDPQRSRPNAIEWYNLPLKGEFIANELVQKHGFDEHGFAVFTKLENDTVPDHIKDRADVAGKMYWTRRIEEFKVGRDKAKSGVSGYKINPDPSLYAQMELLSPDDIHFAQNSQKVTNEVIQRQLNQGDKLADAVALLADFLQRQSEKKAEPITVTMAAPTITEPLVISVTERARAVDVRRRPHESDTVFEARVMEAERLRAKAAAETEMPAESIPTEE